MLENLEQVLSALMGLDDDLRNEGLHQSSLDDLEVIIKSIAKLVDDAT